MKHLVWAAIGLLMAMGCQQPLDMMMVDAPPEANVLGPASMRIHPIFTQPRDWTGDARPDGIEALVEFLDQFGDPTKASGRVYFELFEYQPGSPDPRGERLVNPWAASLDTPDDQRQHWDRTSRAYSFLLAYPSIDPARTYVLTATFERTGGGRFFDRVILEPHRQEPRRDAAQPPAASRPTTRSVAP
jgi:hypothetical protein